MKALIYEKPGNPRDALRVREVPIPSIGPDEVLVHVAYSTVGTTDYLRFGNPLQGQKPGILGRCSDLAGTRGHALGSEVSGTVAAVGECVANVVPGDTVFGATHLARDGWAEYAVTNSRETCRAPQHITLAEAATLGVSPTVALGALRRALDLKHLSLHELGELNVLVNGASGGVGLSTVQIAASQGAHVTGVCGETSFSAVQSHGAQRLIDRNQPDFAGLYGTFDIIVAANGHQPASTYRRLLKKDGAFVVVGGSPTQLIAGLTIMPIMFAASKKQASSVIYASIPKELSTIAELVDRGDFDPLVDEEIGVLDVSDALPRIINEHHVGKVAVRMEF